MNKLMKAAVAALAAAFVAAPAVAAPSLGDTVTCASSAFVCSSATAIVSDGIEFTLDPGLPGSLFTADFSTGLLTIKHSMGTADNSFAGRLNFRDTTSAFTQAILYSSSGVTGFDQSHIQLSGDQVSLFFGNTVNGSTTGTTFAPNATLVIQLAPGATPAVPEPAAWAMMIAGLGAVGFAMRRRQLRSDAAFDRRIQRIAAGETI